MKHRTDIDGMRSLAVMSVVIAHAGGPIPAGHLGVDIFFVLSGFLIGSILLKDFENNTFSFLTFYFRRAKRILPAVIAVSIATALFGTLILPAHHRQDLLESIIAANLFSGNIYFWLTQDYFAPAADVTPFLHTWSLGIEEQFYFLFPIVLIFFIRLKWQTHLALLLLLTCISLAAGYMVSSETRFYLLPFRAWELLVGIIAAVIVRYAQPLQSRPIAWIGLIAVVASLFAFDKNANDNPVIILLPVIGTALLLIYGSSTTSPKLLSWKVNIYLGTISYSLYLIHQPLFAFTRMLWPGVPGFFELIPAIVVAIALAHLTWRFVEEPFRHTKTPEKTYLRRAGLSLSTVLVLLVMMIYIPTTGTPTPQLAKSDPLRNECHLGHKRNNRTTGEHSPKCIIGDLENLDIALVGDSHSATLFTPLADLAQENGWSLLMETYSGCAPYFGRKPTDLKTNCAQHNEKQIAYLEDAKPRLIVVFPRSRVSANTPEEIEYMLDSITTLQNTGAKVLFVLPVHEPGFDVAQTLWKRLNLGLSMPATLEFSNEHVNFAQELTNSLDETGAILFDPTSVFCLNQTCEIVDQTSSIPLFYDDDHLSLLGGYHIVSELETLINEALSVQ